MLTVTKKREKNVDLNRAACMLQPLWKRGSLHLASSLGPLIISGKGEAWGGGGLGRGRPGEGRPGEGGPGEGEAWGGGGLGRGRPGEGEAWGGGGPGERLSCLTWIHLNWAHGNGCKD